MLQCKKIPLRKGVSKSCFWIIFVNTHKQSKCTISSTDLLLLQKQPASHQSELYSEDKTFKEQYRWFYMF